MLKPLLFVGSIAVGIGGGGYHLVERAMPDFSEVARSCMEREAELPPAHRLTTCTCLSAEVSRALWTVRDFVLPSARRDGLREVALNACRAQAFQQLPGEKGPTRMSPMPKLTN